MTPEEYKLKRLWESVKFGLGFSCALFFFLAFACTIGVLLARLLFILGG